MDARISGLGGRACIALVVLVLSLTLSWVLFICTLFYLPLRPCRDLPQKRLGISVHWGSCNWEAPVRQLVVAPRTGSSNKHHLVF